MSTSEPSIPLPQLPRGYTARPVTLDDAEAAAELENAQHCALTGKPSIEAGEIRSEWGQPTMNLATNTLAVFDPAGAMAGLVELWDSEPHVHDFVFAAVHPLRQGLGIGTALAGWVERRGRQLVSLAPEDTRVILRQFKLSDDAAAARLLRQRGYALARHNLRMTIDFNGPLPPPTLPDGLIIRPFIRGQEDRALIMAGREEFRDHWGYVESPFEQEYAERWRNHERA